MLKFKNVWIFILFFEGLSMCACSQQLADTGSKSIASVSVSPTPVERKASPEDVWIPQNLDECLKKLKINETVSVETAFNPFYQRADFDDDKLMDLAIIVKGDSSGKRGLLICRKINDLYLFGELARTSDSVSSFENDNFVTDQWEIVSKSETAKRKARHANGSLFAPDAKGESVLFVFEGGDGLMIYWNGRKFVISE